VSLSLNVVREGDEAAEAIAELLKPEILAIL
jgi:hypothetical protein